MSILPYITGAPIWVWPLLFILIYSGLQARKAQDMTFWRVLITPFICAVFVLMRFFREPLPNVLGLQVALFGVMLGCFIGALYQRGRVEVIGGGFYRLKGEWLTLVLYLALFIIAYAEGVWRAVTPDTFEGPLLSLSFLFIFCSSAGVFCGRSIAILGKTPAR